MNIVEKNMYELRLRETGCYHLEEVSKREKWFGLRFQK